MADEETITIILKAVDAATKPIRSVVQALFGIGKGAKKSERGVRKLLETTANLKHSYDLVKGAASTAFRVANKYVIGLNASLEETTLKIAGSLQALGAVDTFKQGSAQAVSAIEMIRKAAAALPGEVEDYITVFETGLPKAIEAGATSMERITGMTNKFAALAAARGIDAAQAGRDLSLMLSGRAGADVRTFQQLLPIMAGLKKHSASTAKQFNKMLPEDRMKAIEGALGKFNDLFGAFENTASAMTGTLKTQFIEITRAATKPIFDAWKIGMRTTIKLLEDNSGAIKTFAKNIGGVAVKAVNALRDAFTEVLTRVRSVVGESGALANLRKGAGAVVGGFGQAAEAAGGGGAGMVVAGLAAVSPVTAIVVQAFRVLGEDTTAVSSILGSLSEIGASVMSVFGAFLPVVAQLGNALGMLAAGVLPGLFAAISQVTEAVGGLFTGLFDVVGTFLKEVGPTLKEFGEVLGSIFKMVGEVLAPIVELLGGVLKAIFTVVATVLKPAIKIVTTVFGALASVLRIVVDVFTWVIDQIKDLFGAGISAIGRAHAASLHAKTQAALSTAAKAQAVTAARRRSQGLGGGGFVSAAQQFGKETPGALKKVARRKGGGGRGGRINNYDFRNSRFDIRQEFAEGFDPDRVAVAFSEDLADMSERKVQSSLSPLFAVR